MVIFERSVPCYLADTKGMSYISRLLKKSPDHISAIELANPIDEANKSFSKQSIISCEAIQKCKGRISEIEEELQDAKKNHDQAAQDRLEVEKSGIIQQLFSDTRPSSISRNFSDDIEKARKAVSITIKRTLDYIKQHNPILHQHLDSSIQRGKYITYKPDREISWES